jgi:hypothetical protein
MRSGESVVAGWHVEACPACFHPTIDALRLGASTCQQAKAEEMRRGLPSVSTQVSWPRKKQEAPDGLEHGSALCDITFVLYEREMVEHQVL